MLQHRRVLTKSYVCREHMNKVAQCWPCKPLNRTLEPQALRACMLVRHGCLPPAKPRQHWAHVVPMHVALESMRFRMVQEIGGRKSSPKRLMGSRVQGPAREGFLNINSLNSPCRAWCFIGPGIQTHGVCLLSGFGGNVWKAVRAKIPLFGLDSGAGMIEL